MSEHEREPSPHPDPLPSQVSKYAAKAIRDGWLKKKGRLYVLAPASDQKTPGVFKDKPQLSILSGEKPKLSILQRT